MTLRYYVDADCLGLAKVLAQIRVDVTYPGEPGGMGRDRKLRPPCPVTSTDVRDVDWIPIVAAEGWLIITRDSRIRRRPLELAAVVDHGARMVALSARQPLRTFDELELLLRH